MGLLTAVWSGWRQHAWDLSSAPPHLADLTFRQGALPFRMGNLTLCPLR